MTLYQFFYIVALVVNVGLGGMVLAANPKRRLNQNFLVFSLIVACWQLCGWNILHAHDAATAEFYIRIASSIVLFVPAQCWIMGLSICFPMDTIRTFLFRIWPFLAITIMLAMLPLLPSFIQSVDLVRPLPALPPIAEPKYGIGFPIYGVGLIGMALFLIVKWIRDLRTLRGVMRTELGFVALGATAGVFLGNAAGILVPLLTGSSRYMPIAHSISVLVLAAIIAYGITTRRVLDIAEFLRRLLSNILALLYLSALYFIILRFSIWVLSTLLTDLPRAIPYATASIVVAFSMSPAFNWINRMTGHLFVQKSGVELRDAFYEVQRILQTIAPTPDLLRQSGAILERATQASHLEIYLAQDGHYLRLYPPTENMGEAKVQNHDPLVRTMIGRSEPLVIYDIERRPTALLVDAGRQMKALDAVVAVGIYAHNEIRGFILFGPKRSGRIYSRSEQDALQLLCNHLAVSIENARLYTQIQDQSRYLDNLLEHLVSGVIAVNEDGIVTVFNHEARRLTGRQGEEAIGQSFSSLPAPLDDMLAETLLNRQGMRDREVTLAPSGTEAIPVRAGTSMFHGRDGKAMGALLVFNDLRALKSLEEQVRRTDRLAGVGTLAAGMAHEIKNPLVTIKTYAQLLPERFDDPEFRESCSTLLGQEVERIDSLVNQLLRFTRPQKPTLVPLALHELLTNSLRLLAQPARQKGLQIETLFNAVQDRILGDAGQLSQMFLNFYLNAFDAMKRGGTLTVETTDSFCWSRERDLWGEPVKLPALSVSIRDTGRGIPKEDQSRVFDPFFTTKAEGTGLGLSVALGILRDHKGQIELRSEIDKGTTFVLIFPVNAPDGDSES